MFFSFAQDEENKLEVSQEKVEFVELPSNSEEETKNQNKTSSGEATVSPQKGLAKEPDTESGSDSEQASSDTPSEPTQEENSQEVITESSNALSQEDLEIQLKIKERVSTYEYDPILREDPFAQPGIEDIPDFLGEKIHPLEEENMDSLKLKGIIWSNDGVIPRALVEAGGQTYTVSKNDRIGKQGAVIHRIDRNVVWYMKPTRPPGTEQIRYQPERLPLDGSESSNDQKEGGLWYER